MTTLQTFQIAGWAEYNTEGIATLYLSITDESMITQPTDTPANTVFVAAIKNGMDFSIKRAPSSWIWGGAGVQGAAYGSLQLDNFQGQFQFLLTADLRDATVIINFPIAGSLLGATGISSSPLIATAVIDKVTADNENTITISLKDTIARLDKTQVCRFHPPYVDSNSANTMVQQIFGAVRNTKFKLIDTPNRTYQGNDANISNVVSVTDKGAPLDPNASPPQYTPALSGQGLQVATMPVGDLRVDCSSVGSQATIPGTADILAGAGKFPGTRGAAAWRGAVNNSSAVVTNGAVTAGVRITIPVSSTTPFVIGGNAYVTDGTNSAYGSIFTVGGGSVVLNVGATTTGSPASITVGSPCVVPGAPDGFSWTGTIGNIRENLAATNAQFGTSNSVVLTTSTAFSPDNGLFGDQLILNGLVPGRSYRVQFSLYNVQQGMSGLIGGFSGGLLLTNSLSTNSANYMTGINQPLTTPAFRAQYFSFEFTVPPAGSTRLYFIAAPPASTVATVAQGPVTIEMFNLSIELLGQFTQLPLSGIAGNDYYTEILCVRAGESPTIFNAAEAAAMTTRSDGSVMPCGVRYTDPYNILDALRIIPDSRGGVIFTDNAGTIRVRDIIDPSNPTGRVVRADFDDTNVEFNIQVSEDNPSGLTTLWGCRRNWDPFAAAADFVTDTSIVTNDQRARYMRTSQIQIVSSKTPAGSYNVAIGAPIYDTIWDLGTDCQTIADRVVGIWSPQVYVDGTSTTGKRIDVLFTAFWDDPNAVGATITASVTNIMFGDVVRLNYPAKGIVNLYMMVKEWEIWPLAQKIAILGMA